MDRPAFDVAKNVYFVYMGTIESKDDQGNPAIVDIYYYPEEDFVGVQYGPRKAHWGVTGDWASQKRLIALQKNAFDNACMYDAAKFVTDNPLQDGEALGIDTDFNVVCHKANGKRYNSGEPLQDFAPTPDCLSTRELHRLY